MPTWIDPGSLLLLGQQVTVAGPAQAPAAEAYDTAWIALILVVVLGVIVLVGWMGLRHAWKERELEHAERMRALEVGLLLPRDRPFWSPERVAVAIGAGVPLGALVLALAATEVDSAGAMAWPAAGLVGAIGLICGTVLALRLVSTRPESDPNRTGKPVVDRPDHDLAEFVN